MDGGLLNRDLWANFTQQEKHQDQKLQSLNVESLPGKNQFYEHQPWWRAGIEKGENVHFNFALQLSRMYFGRILIFYFLIELAGRQRALYRYVSRSRSRDYENTTLDLYKNLLALGSLPADSSHSKPPLNKEKEDKMKVLHKGSE